MNVTERAITSSTAPAADPRSPFRRVPDPDPFVRVLGGGGGGGGGGAVFSRRPGGHRLPPGSRCPRPAAARPRGGVLSALAGNPAGLDGRPPLSRPPDCARAPARLP